MPELFTVWPLTKKKNLWAPAVDSKGDGCT